MTAPTRSPLDRDSVVAEALAIVDERGLGTLTMRAVATRLGVEPMSLYWHVANKDDLLDAVIARVIDEASLSSDEGSDWREHIRQFTAGYRALLLAHPNVVPLLAQRPVTGYLDAKRAAGHWMRNLESAGFSECQAVDVMRMVVRFVTGFAFADAARNGAEERPGQTLREVDADLRPLIAAVASEDPGRLFEVSVEVLLAGIDAVMERPIPD